VQRAAPAELLVINDRMLRRLQSLYPPTARKVFKNLMTIVCDRLERLTECYLEDSATDTCTSVISRSFFRIMLDKEIGGRGVTIIDDPTIPGGFGSFPYDDEGVKGQRKVHQGR